MRYNNDAYEMDTAIHPDSIDLSKGYRPALWLILSIALLFSLWFQYAPISGAIIADGQIKTEGYRQTVQIQERALVTEVMTSEGERVKTGQILVQLEHRDLLAVTRNLTLQKLDAELQLILLESIIEQKARLTFPPNLVQQAQTLGQESSLKDKQQYFHAITRQQTRELKSLELLRHQSIVQAKSKMQHSLRTKEQLSLLSTELNATVQLVAQGMLAQHQAAQAQSKALELTKTIEILDAERQQALLKQQHIKLQYQQQQQMLLDNSLKERLQIKRDLPRLEKDLALTAQRLERRFIRSPINGRVQGLRVNSVGSQLSASTPILEVIAEQATLLVEARVKPTDIDKIDLSKQAQIRLSAYDSRTTPLLQAELLALSADTFTDARGLPYYQLQLRIPQQQLARIPHIKLYPGMPAQAIIDAGQRSLWEYLFNQLIQHSERSLREV